MKSLFKSNWLCVPQVSFSILFFASTVTENTTRCLLVQWKHWLGLSSLEECIVIILDSFFLKSCACASHSCFRIGLETASCHDFRTHLQHPRGGNQLLETKHSMRSNEFLAISRWHYGEIWYGVQRSFFLAWCKHGWLAGKTDWSTQLVFGRKRGIPFVTLNKIGRGCRGTRTQITAEGDFDDWKSKVIYNHWSLELKYVAKMTLFIFEINGSRDCLLITVEFETAFHSPRLLFPPGQHNARHGTRYFSECFSLS